MPRTDNGAASLGVAQGSNRVNSQGGIIPSPRNRTSLYYSNIVAAGATLPIPCSGTQFYVIIATLPVNIRPAGGIFNSYEKGTGLQLDPTNAFDLLEVQNPNAVAVVFQIFVGFDGFIDNRLILVQSANQQVVYGTYPVSNASATINITDISGSPFTDVNGNRWYALARVCIIVFNADSGTTYALQKASATASTDASVGIIQPLQNVRFDYSGNYRIRAGGVINVIVSEIYEAIPAP